MDYRSPPSDRCLRIYRRQDYYPEPWKSGRIQKVMRKWAGDTCENCGATGVPLDCHHITWKAKHDCRWENLVVVCDRCHGKIHRHKWQPGQHWKLSPTPEWMTARGYTNPADSQEHKHLSDRSLESAEKHIKLGQALQSRGYKILQESPLSAKRLKEAAIAIETGCKVERQSRHTLLRDSGTMTSDRLVRFLAESTDAFTRHTVLGTALQKYALDLAAQGGSVSVSAIALERGASVERSGLDMLAKLTESQ